MAKAGATTTTAAPRSVMVVGGAGFLGSHLVERLIGDGLRVEVVDDLSTGGLANLAAARAGAPEGALRIDTVDVTIPEFPDLVRRRRPDVMVVTAAFTGERTDSADAVRSFAVVAAALESCRVAGVSKVVVVVPGAAMYGEVPTRELPVREDRERHPVGVQGVAVGAALELVDLYRRDHGLDHTALVLSTIYGPRQNPTGNLVASLLAARAAGETPVIHGDGKQTIDLLFVDDAVDAIARSLTKGSGQTLHVATGTQTSLRALLQAIGIESVVSEPKRPGAIQRSALSPSRARLHLGWAPWTALVDGLATTVA